MKKVLLAAIAIAAALGVAHSQTMPQPPTAPTVEHVVTWHGQAVSDPWFWLRQKDSPAVLAHLKTASR